uniref:Suppressor of forked domain-containing protein n=1 Tax=Arcella intermedia TaxID=1963864 RepID=A0A6B2KY33_9EUKA
MNNRFSLKSWCRYLQHKKGADPTMRFMIYERALKEIPGSYKLWFNYLLERKSQIQNYKMDHPIYQKLINIFERALTFMHKYPRIWLEYLNFLIAQSLITLTRRTFDRALCALPVTQHDRIWPGYIKFVRIIGIPETAIRVYRRYLKLEPNHIEEYIDYLEEIQQFDEAAKQLAKIINSETFVSIQGKSKHELWMRLCKICSQNPEKITSVKVEAMIRSGLVKFTNEIAHLWTSLAEYFVGLGNFEKARDVYEEAINTVMTIRDFSQIWDAYVEFEYSVLSAKIKDMTEAEEKGQEVDQMEEEEFQFQMARYEDLVDRQAILISNVLLRQNPHNVNEWHKRIQLFKDNPKQVVLEYTRALTEVIDPKKATGKLYTLWVNFAKFWEERGKLSEARQVFEKAATVEFKKIDHLAAVWCEYIEMELRNLNFSTARELAQRATTVPSHYRRLPQNAPTTSRLYKSIRLWHLYADLEESFGTLFTTKAVYEKILDLRIASPATILNYAKFLEDNNFYEESFKVYEKGVAIFKFPAALDIWITYLNHFIDRYGGAKLERLRDLFEQAVETAPANFSAPLYLLYAEAEEKFGLSRHAMVIYDRATKAIEPVLRPKMFNIYIKRATENFGITRTRQIFEKAIEDLPDQYAKSFALRYANLERRLGEIDRARSIYTYCSQLCPPAQDPNFWETWKLFEVKHGNVDTVREMYRIKRSVAAQFNLSVNFNVNQNLGEGEPSQVPQDEMQKLEATTRAIQPPQPQQQPAAVSERPKNADEIQLDDEEMEPPVTTQSQIAVPARTSMEMEEEEENEKEKEKEDDVVIETKEVPRMVFGSAADQMDLKKTKKKGAKERLKKRI